MEAPDRTQLSAHPRLLHFWPLLIFVCFTDASETTITKVKEVFAAEKIHRLSWMMARYLDTPLKIETAITSIVSATHQLQGNKIDYHTIDQIITGFTSLRNKLREHGSPGYDHSQDAHISVEMHVSDDEVACAKNEAKLPIEEKSTHDKKHKVSKTWRWAVDKENVHTENIAAHFKRRSDLFAYHALPVAKQEVSSRAGKREVRTRIEELLRGLSDREIEDWKDCFVKLQKGDLSMLDRVISKENNFKDHGNASRSSRGTSVIAPEQQPKRKWEAQSKSTLPGHVRLKREGDDDEYDMPEHDSSREADGVDDTIPAFRRLSTEDKAPVCLLKVLTPYDQANAKISTTRPIRAHPSSDSYGATRHLITKTKSALRHVCWNSWTAVYLYKSVYFIY